MLRIIGGSRGEIDEVMPAILGYALTLCDAEFGILFEHREKACFHASFSKGLPSAFRTWLADQGEFPVDPATALGRMEATRAVVNIVDVRAEAVFRSSDPLRHATAVLGGARSFVAIPMLAAERLVGAFTIYRQSVRPFNAQATSLARLFAEQSVVAIENARIVSELRSARQAPMRS
ncbi:MAG: hypothetical protein Kilf2KO_44920 [Rhodospirillales bacterium]